MKQIFTKSDRGRSRKIWWETFYYDMSYKDLIENKAMDKNDKQPNSCTQPYMVGLRFDMFL